MNGRRPNFLVIGAYKSGTTSLFRDLTRHPDIEVPEAKEVAHLTNAHVLTEDGLASYESFFRPLRNFAQIGEIAPQYTAAPRWDKVAERAAEILGQDLRLIYMVRHPIDRIVSHLRHNGISAPPVETWDSIPFGAFFEADVSRYGTQIAPWVEQFGRGRILVVRFEDYCVNAVAVRERIIRFLGLNPAEMHDAPRVHENAASNKPAKPAWLKRMLHKDIYRARIKPALPWPVRRGAARMVTTLVEAAPAPFEAGEMSNATAEALHTELVPEIQGFYDLLGLREPLWAEFPIADQYPDKALHAGWR